MKAKTKPKTKGKTIVKKAKNGDVVIIKKKKDYVVGKGKPPKEHQFKKGQSGNPLGPNVNPEKRALRELTTRELKAAIEKTMTCTEEEVQALLDDPQTTVGHKVILRAALDASTNGDYSKFDHILERAIGKVANKVDLTTRVKDVGEEVKDKEAVRSAVKELENEF